MKPKHTQSNKSKSLDAAIICIGITGNGGCGYKGGYSGGICPKCHGMLLSERCIRIADEATEKWKKSDLKNEMPRQLIEKIKEIL